MELDEQVLEEIRASLEEYQPKSGSRLKHIRTNGSYPDTVIEVVYETALGEESQSYAVFKQFGTEDPEEIGFWVWRDVDEHF
jgi:hypothetical protein